MRAETPIICWLDHRDCALPSLNIADEHIAGLDSMRFLPSDLVSFENAAVKRATAKRSHRNLWVLRLYINLHRTTDKWCNVTESPLLRIF